MKKVLFSRAYALAVPTLFFAIFIAFAFFFASFSSAYPAEAAGETTEISTVEEMVAFSQAMQTSSGVGMRVELKADLDLSGSDFLPIGNSSHSFEGSFYGNDHTLIVDIENNGGGATGVFAYTGSGCYITGLVVRGSVSGNNYVGGIVGDADGGRIEKCVSFAEVTGSTYVGGLVGSCKGAVTACSSFATVRGRNTFGGAIGILQGSRSSLTESVFIGKVISNTGTTFGGLVGNSMGELKDNYAAPTFEGSLAVSYGSVIGTLSSISKGVSYCYGISDHAPVGSNSAGVLPETLASKTSYEFLSGSVGFASDTVLAVPAFDVGFGFYPCPSYQLTAQKDDFVAPYDTLCKGKFIVCLFASGTGSASDPFTVMDERQWDLFITNSRLYDYSDRLVVLGASVAAGSVRSVGSSSVPFAGIFDGRNNTITFSCASVSDGSGLFAAVSGATVKNVVLSGQVTGGQKVGLAAGCAKGTENSFIGITALQGSVVSGNSYVGAIVGGADEGTNINVRECVSYASVYGGTHVGGLVGQCAGQAYITESANYGAVTDSSNGGRYVGGIFGLLSGTPHLSELINKGTINAPGCTSVGGIGGSVSGAAVSLCSSVAPVAGRFGVGGLFGEITADVSLTSCAYIGAVTGVNGLGGAVGDLISDLTLTVTDFYCAVSFVKDKAISLSAPFRAFCIASPQIETTTELTVAYEYSSADDSFRPTADLSAQAGKTYYRFASDLVLRNVYYDSDVYLGVNTNGATARSTVSLTDGDRSRFDTQDAWKDVSATLAGGYYPVPAYASSADYATVYFAGGDGTADKPLLISNEKQFRNFAEFFNGYPSAVTGKYFSQTANITLTRPISVITYFNGTYDGNNHTIGGLNITSAESDVGLFATASGVLKNICVDGGSIVATASSCIVGGLVAVGNAEITRCYTALDITCEAASVCGGLIGVNEGSVNASFFAGTLRGGTCAGGLIGRNNGGIVTSVFTTGTVFASQLLGGVIGYNNGGQLSFSSTNVIAKLTGDQATFAIGGLIGENRAGLLGGDTGRVLSCLSNAWLVYEGSVQKGGLVGNLVSGFIATGDIDGNGSDDNSYFNLDYATGISNDGMGTLTDIILETNVVSGGEVVRAFRIPGFTYAGLGVYNVECDARYALRPTAIVEWADSVYRVNYYSARGAEMIIWRYDFSIASTHPRGSKNNPYLISSPEELVILSDSTQYFDYSGKYFLLEANLNMASVDMVRPIGFYRDSDYNYSFNGQLDGQGYAIRNLTIDFYAYQSGAGRLDSDNKYVALFGYTGPDFVLKRLTMESSCLICGGPYAASFVGYFNGRIEECLSMSEIVSVQKTTVTASTYQEGAFLTWSSEGVYVPCSGPYSSTTVYYTSSSGVGGFVGDLVSAGCSIVGSYFCGTLPDVPDAYGFVGVTGTALALTTDNSWYLTKNREYPYESSYGRVLISYNDDTNGGYVSVRNDWDGTGFYLVLGANEKYYPFIYNNNLDALSLSSTYRLSSNTQVKYQVRFCQEVVFTVENGIIGTETVMTAQGNKAPIGGKYYYYKDQEGSVTFTWRTHGYYLTDSVTVNGVTSSFGTDIINGTEEEIVFSFVMGETADTFVIKVTVAEITASEFEFTGVSAFDYNGSAHSVDCTVGTGFAANVAYINADSSVRTDLINAGNYYAVASLRYAGGSVVIGKKEITCTVAPKTLTVDPGADLGYFGEKVYDGNATSRVSFTDTSVFVGLLAGDEETLAVSALVTWDTADSGENKTYSLSDFTVTLTGNYVFAPGYEITGLTGGTISRRRVVVSVPGAVTTTLGTSDFEVKTVVYSGKSPVAPEGAYVVSVSWTYQKMIVSGSADPVTDTAWSGKYDIGYYLMTPSLADETNHYLDAEGKTYYLNIIPYTVTSLTFVYNTLTYTGAALTSSVTAYFPGVGEDGSRQNVSIDYYVRRPDVTEGSFRSGLFVRNEAGTGFVEATSYSATASYYVAATLRKAGTYYAVCRSIRDNYVVAAPIREITVAKATPSQSIGFFLTCGGVEIENGGSVYYTDDIVITFTDALSLKTADAEYDATYALTFDSRLYGGDLSCEQKNGEWHIVPQEYGASMVFRLVSLSASDYENRVSETAFTLTVLPVKLYVGITHPEQVFGDELDFSLTYYKNAQHTETVSADEIDGLFAPVVTTGAFTADKVGEYQLFYGGGSSYGYEFDRTTVPTLTIVPRQAYVAVPAEVSNTKIYGESDPAIRYYVYADAACTQRLTVLPDGREIVLNGKLSRQEGENVGSYNIYSGTIVSSELNPDYVLTFVSGNGKFVINYLDIRLQVKEGQGKFYGDRDHPYELEVAEGYALAFGDLVSSFLFGENPIVTITREEGETVGSYAYIVTVDYSMAALGNYNILSVETPGYYYINRVRPTISFTFDDVVYFGDTTEHMNCATARAYNDTEVVPGTFSWATKTFDSLNVTTVTLNFTPKDTRNYTGNTMTVVIRPQKRPVYPIFTGATEYVYDGSAHNDLTVQLDNTVSGGTYSVRTSVSGDNRTVTTDGFIVTAELTSDYYVFPADAHVSVQCRIVPAVLTVRVQNAAINVGDTFLPEIVYEGFVRSESESVLTTRATVGVKVGSDVKDAIPAESGVYTVMPKGAAAKNYTFVYVPGVLTINKLTAESDGISVAGSFSPDVEVMMEEVEAGSYAFEDLESVLNKKLGATIFQPLPHCLASYYDIRLSGALEDEAEYAYTVTLTEALPADAKVYLRGKDGTLTELEDYTTDGNDIVFYAGDVDGLVVYRAKTQEETLKGYIPLAAIGGAVIVLIMLIGIFAYFGRHRRGKSVYRAQRATYKVFPHRK